VTNCHQLKMIAGDGKKRLTDAATAETLLRLAQSVATGMKENKKASKQGGGIAKKARKELEEKNGSKGCDLR